MIPDVRIARQIYYGSVPVHVLVNNLLAKVYPVHDLDSYTESLRPGTLTEEG